MFEQDESAIAVGNRLKRIRQMAGLKRAELAKEADVGKTSISYWEHAKSESSMMTATSRRKILDAIRKHGVECTERWLLTGTGPEPKMIGAQLPIETTLPSAMDVILQNKHDVTLADELRLFLSSQQAVIVTIIDNSMLPLLEQGDVVGGLWLPSTSLQQEKICIVEINNKLQVRRVKKDKNGLFHLSYTVVEPNQAEPYEIKKVHLEKLAPISRIWR